MSITRLRDTDFLYFYEYRNKTAYFPSADLSLVVNFKTIMEMHENDEILSAPENIKIFEKNFLDLRSDKRSLLVAFSSSIYHCWYESIGPVLYELSLDKNLRVIIVLRSTEIVANNVMLNHFTTLLSDINAEYIVYHSIDHDGFFIDNFYYPNFGKANVVEPTRQIYNATRIYVDEPNKNPTKTVYLSRTKVEGRRDVKNISIKPGLRFYHDLRIDNEKMLEEYFRSKGIEIVYPEDFDGLSSQVNFFNDVKTLISISGSGLTNMAFMHPGNTVIELVTTLTAQTTFGNPPNEGEEALHHFYPTMAYEKGHRYVGIPNINQSAEEIISFFEEKNVLLGLM